MTRAWSIAALAFLLAASAAAAGGACSASPDVGSGGSAPSLELALLVSPACLTSPLAADDDHDDGAVSCVVIEAWHAAGSCGDACNGPARAPVTSADDAARNDIEQSAEGTAQGLDCFCEIAELSSAALSACETDTSPAPSVMGTPIDGWCYVDPATDPRANPALVAACPPGERRLVRFVGAGAPRPGASVFVVCPSG